MNCPQHPAAEAAAYCQSCGRPLCGECIRSVEGMTFCETCLAEGHSAATLRGRSPVAVPFVAAVLGFIPGVGAMYNGQLAKALAHVLIFGILVVLSHSSVIFSLLIPAWVFYQVFEAYQTAKARLEGRPLPDPLGLNNIGSQILGAPAANPPAGQAKPAAPAPEPPREPPRQPSPRGPAGAILLIVIGLLLLSRTLGIFQADWLSRAWPFLLMLFGGWLLVRQLLEESRLEPSARRPARAIRGASFLILLGILWSLAQWNLLRFDRSWPVFLILAGILLLFERAEQAGKPPRDTPQTGPHGDSSSMPGGNPPGSLGLERISPIHEVERRSQVEPRSEEGAL